MVALVKGKTFSTFSELDNFIREYERTHFTQLYISNSSKLGSKKSEKIQKAKFASPDLQYISITYCCIMGGRKYFTKGKGLRKTSTFRNDCPFEIHVVLSFNGKTLEIIRIINEHNHALSEEIFKSLPQQKKKSVLQQDVQRNFKTILWIKDLHSVNIKSSTFISQENFKDTVMYLQFVDSATVEVLVNEQEFEGLYFQTSRMKRAFSAYPEIILSNVTYCLNNSSMPLYILLVIDGNKQVEVACTFLLAQENELNIALMLEIFKKYNNLYHKIETIFTDKNSTERQAMKAAFPSAALLLCVFHTLYTFQRKIFHENIINNQKERIDLLKQIQGVVYSKTEQDFNENYLKLMKLSGRNENFRSYFNNNWLTSKDEWVVGLIKQKLTMNITTTNPIENLVQDITQIVSRNNPILTFFKDLNDLFNRLHEDAKVRAVQMMRQHSLVHPKGSLKEKYDLHLTPFAATCIAKEIDRSNDLDAAKDNTTSIRCDCDFFNNVRLPCCHIFYHLKQNNEDMFSQLLIPEKYSKTFHCKHYLNTNDKVIYNIIMEMEDETELTTSHQKHLNVSTTLLKKSVKYKKAIEVGHEISSALAEKETSTFLKLLKRLEKFRDDVKREETKTSNEFEELVETSREDKSCDMESESAICIVDGIIPAYNLEDCPVNEHYEDSVEATNDHTQDHQYYVVF